MCQWCNDCFGGRCIDVDAVCTGRDLCHGQSQTVVNADGCRRLTQSQCVTLDCTDCINTDGCVWMQHDVFQHLSGMCAYSLMLWNLHIGMCTLMSLITHLHGLHLNVQYVQTGVITCWHNCTVQRRLVVKHTIVSFVTDHAMHQPVLNVHCHTWLLLNHFNTGQGTCLANLYRYNASNLNLHRLPDGN